jgi:hypothetical protein
MNLIIMNSKYNSSLSSVPYTFFLYQVALRALGFDIHKTEVQKLMRDYDRQGKNKITYHDFHEIGKYLIEFTDLQINFTFF